MNSIIKKHNKNLENLFSLTREDLDKIFTGSDSRSSSTIQVSVKFNSDEEHQYRVHVTNEDKFYLTKPMPFGGSHKLASRIVDYLQAKGYKSKKVNESYFKTTY